MPHHLTPRARSITAWACLLSLATVPAQAAITVTGPVQLQPNPGALPIGPGDIDLPDSQLFLGRSAGSFTATAGSQATVAYFNFWGNGLATSTALLDGPGTRMNLAAAGTTNRFGLGNARGQASMVVSGGAVLDGAFQNSRCDSGQACQNVIGAAAGGQGLFTVTGAGSEAWFVRKFNVANMNYNSGVGLAGQNTVGTVNVLAGALLNTEWAFVGEGFYGSNLNGSERAIATLTVSGPQSRWDVGGSAFLGGEARFQAAMDGKAEVELYVNQGGVLQVLASPPERESSMLLGMGGRFTGTVAGSGSALRMLGDGSSGVIDIGAQSGSGTLRVTDGARLDAPVRTLRIGVGEGQGRLELSGAATVAELGAAQVAVGDGAATTGTGVLQVTQGAVLNAGRVDIAPRGLLGGSGTVNAPVFNAGTINPGDSPGTLTLGAGLTSLPGARIVLEIDGDGAGGFATDRLVFAGGAPELAGVQVVFSFLGSTDPAAFLAAGQFDIGSFLRVGSEPIAPALLAGASYAATSAAFVIENFSYSPQAGASFVATPVPEPATWLLWAAGLAGVGRLVNGRLAQARHQACRLRRG